MHMYILVNFKRLISICIYIYLNGMYAESDFCHVRGKLVARCSPSIWVVHLHTFIMYLCIHVRDSVCVRKLVEKIQCIST